MLIVYDYSLNIRQYFKFNNLLLFILVIEILMALIK